MARKRRGQLLGVPYDWRRPTAHSLKKGIWNPDEPRVVVPKVFGWGYGVNLAAVWRRLVQRST